MCAIIGQAGAIPLAIAILAGVSTPSVLTERYNARVIAARLRKKVRNGSIELMVHLLVIVVTFVVAMTAVRAVHHRHHVRSASLQVTGEKHAGKP